MVSTILLYVCLAGAVLLAPLSILLWLHEKGIRPVDELLGRFRRLPHLAQLAILVFVVNLIVYFRHTAEELTTDLSDISEWQGGDIVVFPHHIAVVSDMRNYKGVPFILHHGYEGQTEYEEDMLGTLEIIGHFRVK